VARGADTGWLVFIDTNVLLDFYRMASGEPAKRQLQFIDQNHALIITGSQVQMEFMKHRQKVIMETIKSIKNANGDAKQFPPILIEARPAELIKKAVSEIDTQQKRIRNRIEKILLDPLKNDEVYKCVQRLFKSDGDCHLSRTKPSRHSIRRLAWKRWFLGYPPRKKDDTSIGDAVNWEWIVDCAKRSKKNVIIVSRDGDYGTTYNNDTYLNDWLRQEFKQRVGSNLEVQLTNRLTEAMKMLKLKVTKGEEQEEARLLTIRIPSDIASAVNRASASGVASTSEWQTFISTIKARDDLDI
jgi:predicted DNA binding CopG/RHH family protein